MNQESKKVLRIIQVAIIAWSIAASNALYSQANDNSSVANRSITIMSYNLKFASPTYKPLWEERRDMQLDLINKYRPDIIGTQEGLKEQIDYLADHLPEYEAIGEGRQGGDDDEHMVIFYKRDKFRLRALNSFALSKTPTVLGSGPSINPRMVTWARLAFINIPKYDTKEEYPMDYRGHWKHTKEFYVFNTHFFNGSKDTMARRSAAELVKTQINKLDRFGEWTQERPVFLIGDFNCHPQSVPHKILVGDGSKNDSSFLKETNMVNSEEIDWVLYKGKVEIQKYQELDYNINGIYPSDHKPILVEFLIK